MSRTAPAPSAALRFAAFAALAGFAALHWIGLVADPPIGRAAVALIAVCGGAATLALIARAQIRRVPAWTLALVVSVVATAASALAIGLPARLLAPANWGELVDHLVGGVEELGNADYPYGGPDPWARLAILLGLSLGLGLAAAFAFWPVRRVAPALRTLALVTLVAGYATAATLRSAGAPLLGGFGLALLVAAWLWLPALRLREALPWAACVAAAAALAVPLAARLDVKHAWLDYRHWSWNLSALDHAESFTWAHVYGPMWWQRSGRALLDVQSDAPHYWRADVLDQFDGFRWVESEQGDGFWELPRRSPRAAGTEFSPQTVPLNPKWVHRISFTVRGLRSDLVVGAGAILSVAGVDGPTPIASGVATSPGDPLEDGDSYTVRTYAPSPSPKRMRKTPAHYPRALRRYATISVPRKLTTGGDTAVAVTLKDVTVPLRGQPRGGGRAARLISRSPYGGIYRLTRRLTAGAPTTYDAVERIERYLRGNYAYSESPPRHRYPLRAFLFKDRAGYCQHFSGAMALMLRMVGIPTRVAAGFSPGTPQRDGSGFVVRDWDAHSWVEVYFNRIGWVPFDPTPGAAPAKSQASGLRPLSPNAPSTGAALPRQGGGALKLRRGGSRPAIVPSRGSLPAWPVPLFATLPALAAAIALGLRRHRFRALPPAAAAEARLRELEAALARLRSWTTGGTTLLALEQRLVTIAGPPAAGYAAKLRAARYEPRDPGPPSAEERRALRRGLTAGLGLGGRLRGLLAIPPGGPAPRRAARRGG